jgi:xanthine dehydrogenase accessory factor
VKELLEDLERWRVAGKRAALARVVDMKGSGPRDPGAAMAVNEDGEVVGSVSGGCVEGAVLTEGLSVLRKGEARLVSYGIADEDAFSVGLTCGGTIHIFIDPPDETGEAIQAALRTGEPAALATIIEGPEPGAAEPRARGVPVKPGARGVPVKIGASCWSARTPSPSAPWATPTSTGWWPATPSASWRPAEPGSATTAPTAKPAGKRA